MIVPPSLEASTRLVGIVAVDLNQLVQHATGEIEGLIPHVLAEYEKHLMAADQKLDSRPTD